MPGAQLELPSAWKKANSIITTPLIVVANFFLTWVASSLGAAPARLLAAMGVPSTRARVLRSGAGDGWPFRSASAFRRFLAAQAPL
jgi:hypothetical protein